MIHYLIIGCNGLIGKQLSTLCEMRGYSYVGTYYKRKLGNEIRLDITSENDVRNIILEKKPKNIIHCANLKGGANFCEASPSKAECFHLKATRYIGKAAKEINASVVFFSSDYVFDGKKNEAYNENDRPNPINVYGRLKLEAEVWLKKTLKKYIILRTTNVYGWDPDTVTPNFMMGLYLKAINNEKCCVPSYLFGNPTYAGDLADISTRLCEKKIYGLFHAVGDEQINRYKWAKKIFSKFNLEMKLLEEQKTDQVKVKTPRPLNSNLSNTLIKRVAKFNFKTIDEGLNICFRGALMIVIINFIIF